MKSFRKLLLLSALLPLLSAGSVYGTDANVAIRGGGGEARGGGFENRGDYENRAGELRRDGYGNFYEGGIGGYGGGYVAPYGYPVGGYLENTNPFPDDASADAIYRANQHPGE